MFPTTKSPSVILYMAPHCPVGLLHRILIEILEFTQFICIQRGFSCAQCNAYLLYCVRACAINSQRAVKGGQHKFLNDSIASSFCHLFAWKFFPEWKHFVVSINVHPPQLWGGEHTELCFNHVTVFSQSVTRIRVSHIILLNVYNLLNMLSICRALTRPGRFDMKVVVPRPDVKGRQDILDLYLGKVKVSSGELVSLSALM